MFSRKEKRKRGSSDGFLRRFLPGQSRKRDRPDMKKLPEQLLGLKEFVFREDNRNKFIVLIALGLVMAAFQAGRGMTEGKYVVSGDKVTGVIREDASEAVSFPLEVEISKDGKKEKKNVSLDMEGKSAEGDSGSGFLESKEKTTEELLEEALDRLAESGGRRAVLPRKLPDGSRLKWERPRSLEPLVMLFLPLLIIIAMYVDERKKTQDAWKTRMDDVRMCLPGFNDQLLLLLNCGLIVNDAIIKISDGYEGRKDNGWFRNWIIQVRKMAETSQSSLVRIFTEEAKKSGIRDLVRLGGYIGENMERGTDLARKLESESEQLWNRRKQLAEERGKKAETKLAFPLGILLVVLVVITAAPAMLQM